MAKIASIGPIVTTISLNFIFVCKIANVKRVQNVDRSRGGIESVTNCVAHLRIFTARCYAERGYATVSRLSVCLCLSVCPSVCDAKV